MTIIQIAPTAGPWQAMFRYTATDKTVNYFPRPIAAWGLTDDGDVIGLIPYEHNPSLFTPTEVEKADEMIFVNYEPDTPIELPEE